MSQSFTYTSIAYYTRAQRNWRGVYWFHLVRLSDGGQNNVFSVASTILAGSISYLHILSSNFRRCVACKVYFNIKIWNFGKFFKFVTFESKANGITGLCTMCFNQMCGVIGLLMNWGWVKHICVRKLTTIGSDNGLEPVNAGILLIGHLGANFNETLIEICRFSFKKMHLNMSSGKWWPFCFSLNVLSEVTESHWAPTDFIYGCLIFE